MPKKVKDIKGAIIEGDEKCKSITYKPCECSMRVVKGNIDRFNFCQEHWKEINEMEMPDIAAGEGE